MLVNSVAATGALLQQVAPALSLLPSILQSGSTRIVFTATPEGKKAFRSIAYSASKANRWGLLCWLDTAMIPRPSLTEPFALTDSV